jgi:hypothetical protein
MTDIFKSVLRNVSGSETTYDLAKSIMNECSSAWFDTTKSLGDEFQFLEMFENSIGVVVSSGFSNHYNSY